MRALIINCVSDTPELNLYKGLSDIGVQLELILDPRDSAKQELIDYGIPTETLEIRNRLDFSAIKAIHRKLRQNPFDLVYAPTSRGISTLLLASRKLPVKAITYRGTIGHLSRFDPAARLSHLNPRVDRIVCNCEAVKRYLLTLKLPKSRLEVVFKGHNPSWYESLPKASREEFGIPKDAFVVGCIANIRPVKGVDVLITAISRMTNVPIHVLLVGNNDDPKILPLIRKLGLSDRVHLVGFQENAAGVAASCDITAMPSIAREGVPRAIMESMSLGVPVIGSDVGGIPEVVSDGETGRIVPAGNVDALRKVLEQLAKDENLRRQLGQRARERIEEKFSLDLYINGIHKLFERVISNDSEVLRSPATG